MELVRSWGLEAEVRGDAIDVEWLGWMGDTLASPTGSALPVGFPTRHQSALISPTGTACVSQGHSRRCCSPICDRSRRRAWSWEPR
jgi:hypothetical protein